jgi:hypothetical protein
MFGPNNRFLARTSRNLVAQMYVGHVGSRFVAQW